MNSTGSPPVVMPDGRDTQRSQCITCVHTLNKFYKQTALKRDSGSPGSKYQVRSAFLLNICNLAKTNLLLASKNYPLRGLWRLVLSPKNVLALMQRWLKSWRSGITGLLRSIVILPWLDWVCSCRLGNEIYRTNDLSSNYELDFRF